MILKLDLEKAYDRLEWNFFLDSLNCLDIPQDLKSLIFHCIYSASMSINWNGARSEAFNMSRGLRQGDPISPYLFVLCLERLGHRIKDAINFGDWLPYNFGVGDSPKIFHMCFADGLILVAEASMNQVDCINSILHSFYSKSGQKVNLHKS